MKVFQQLFLLMMFTLAQTKELEKVTLQFHWKNQFEFAGFFMAKELGFYKDVGLDVDLVEFELGTDIVKDVLEAKSTFGINYSNLILEKANSKNIVLLSAIFQSSPHVLISLKSSGIRSIKDFKNKKIMINTNATGSSVFTSMLQANGLSKDDITRVEHTFDIQDLIDGKTDLFSGYSSNEPYALVEKGIEYDIWDPKEYGFDFYDLILFTSAKELKDHPQRVEAFRSASLKGWEYALSHIDESVKVILKKYNTQNRTYGALLFEANIEKELAYLNTTELGLIEKDRVKSIYGVYNLMGLTKNRIDYDEFIYKVTKQAFLTKKEREYLKKKKFISICVDPDWMPFEKIENGKHIGISQELIQLVSNIIDTPVKLVQTSSWSESITKAKSRECDIFSLASKTDLRSEFMDFSSAYIVTPIVIATKIGVPFIDSLAQVSHKKLGVVKGYSLHEELKKDYPNINLVEVESIHDGLRKVENGEIWGYLDNSIVINYNIQTNHLGTVAISGKFDHSVELAIASRSDEPILAIVLNKAIQQISEKEKQNILDRWVKIDFAEIVDYTIAIYVGLLMLGVIIFLFYREFILSRLNRQLNILVDKKTKDLQEINEKLDEKVRERTNELLTQKSKMQNMGEMVGNIAHQWRQPLSVVNLCLGILKHKRLQNRLSEDEFKKQIANIQSSTLYMSQTIEDFLTYFRPNKIKEKFNVNEAVNKALSIVNNLLYKSAIKVNVDVDKSYTIDGFKDEYVQVVISIISNSIAILESKKLKKIDISATRTNKIVLSISDTGGGIDEKIIDRIFEPYFTTKHQSEGTGLGLYIAKMIIENNMEGKIDVQNTKDGALFTIKS
ncbi:MAG: transporter substrate-binding domain-containing protein [Helicobacteraceae bacterium]|nr:transporter substrate-binding domain-containing protein [Helicobacteraceae bacterium]